MASSGEHPRVFEALQTTVCTDDDIEFVVAFGSHVTGSTTQGSDLDVAIKFIDRLSSRERFEKRCFLSGTLQQDTLPFIDLSDIETLPLDVAHDAVSGVFVCGDEHAFGQFKSGVNAAFEAQRDERRRQRAAVIDRIAEEGLRS